MQAEGLGPQALAWLTKEGFSVEQTARNGYSSRFNIYSSGRPDFKILVSQAAGDDKIVLAAGVILAENQRRGLVEAPFEKRTELAVGLGALLHGRSIPFNIEEDQGAITRITMSRAIYSDGFTKDNLMRSINELFSTATLVLINLGDFFARLQNASRDIQHHSAVPTTAMPANPQAGPVCPRCGSTARLQQKFCAKCGASLTPTAGSSGTVLRQ
jgi:hypothetical protein